MGMTIIMACVWMKCAIVFNQICNQHISDLRFMRTFDPLLFHHSNPCHSCTICQPYKLNDGFAWDYSKRMR